jgi:hypothetical protein
MPRRRATVVWVRRVGSLRANDVHDVRHAATRTRDATRRLRASTVHDPYVFLGPLDLTRTRH